MKALAAYSKVKKQTQETLVKTYAVLVKRIAHHLLARLPQTVQLEDLIQAGMIGLLEAEYNYDSSKGASFETYAGIRIKGHMLDEVRRNDWVPRSVYRNSRKISEAVQFIENRLGREAKDIEVASYLEVSLAEYHQMLQDAAGSHLYEFDDLDVPHEFSGGKDISAEPQEYLLHKNFMMYLTQLMNSLPSKEQLVLSLYYERDLNLKEIAQVIEVSESRISQILTQAILHIRARLPA